MSEITYSSLNQLVFIRTMWRRKIDYYFSSLKSRTLRFHSSYYDFGMLRECKHAFQTRTSANTGPAIYSRIAPTLLVASNVPVSPATKATVSIAKVRVSFFLSRSFTTSVVSVYRMLLFLSVLFTSRQTSTSAITRRSPRDASRTPSVATFPPTSCANANRATSATARSTART